MVTHILLMLVRPDDATNLLADLTSQACSATRFPGRGGLQWPALVAIAAFATPAQIPLVLSAALRTCARRNAPATGHTVFPALLLDPLESETGGATIFALAARNGVRWSLDRAPTNGSPYPNFLVGQHYPENASTAMDLLVAIVPDAAVERALNGLSSAGTVAAAIGSTGGFLQRGNTTLLIGVPSGRARDTAEFLRHVCRAVAGSGVAFALNTAWHLQF